jgi:hypothetical protein
MLRTSSAGIPPLTLTVEPFVSHLPGAFGSARTDQPVNPMVGNLVSSNRTMILPRLTDWKRRGKCRTYPSATFDFDLTVNACTTVEERRFSAAKAIKNPRALALVVARVERTLFPAALIPPRRRHLEGVIPRGAVLHSTQKESVRITSSVRLFEGTGIG